MILKLEAIFNYFIRRLTQVMQIIKLPVSICIIFNNFRHRLILKELSPYLHRSFIECNLKKFDNYADNSGIIWVFWWQGEQSMPLIVRRCYESIYRHSLNHQCVLITKYNVHKYAELPSYIYNKLNQGNISFTHFSDILRFNLLSKYGGLWLDSTIFCVADLTNKYFNNFYTANVGYDGYHFSVSLGKWTSFLIGGSKSNPFFRFMDLFFQYYWKNNDISIDYFMMDYAIYYAYIHNIGNLKYCIDYDDYQPNMFKLMNLMNQRFNLNIFNNIKANTQLFKLTYKKKIKNSNNSFFYMLFNSKL